jgi:hypothetical protein
MLQLTIFSCKSGCNWVIFQLQAELQLRLLFFQLQVRLQLRFSLGSNGVATEFFLNLYRIGTPYGVIFIILKKWYVNVQGEGKEMLQVRKP